VDAAEFGDDAGVLEGVVGFLVGGEGGYEEFALHPIRNNNSPRITSISSIQSAPFHEDHTQSTPRKLRITHIPRPNIPMQRLKTIFKHLCHRLIIIFISFFY